jgi:hypothetical protein
VSANLMQLLSLIDEVDAISPDTTTHLCELAQSYQYERLLELFQQRRNAA